jgi:KUP system potassium uptake protein
MHKVWRWPVWLAAVTVSPFLLVEGVFLASNLLKLADGGYVPLFIAFCLIIVMWTWVRGSALLSAQTRRDAPLAVLFQSLFRSPPARVRGTAIFLTADPDHAPGSLLHNLKHNQVLHDHNVILTIKSSSQPRVPDPSRVHLESVLPGLQRLTLSVGFMEMPDVTAALKLAREKGFQFDIMRTSFFVSRRSILPSVNSDMPLWQDKLFIYLAKNALSASSFFNIPTSRIVELGNQVII